MNSSFDPKIDVYIQKSMEFAQPILVELRGMIHEACPSVKESIKWGMPAFDYYGPLCNIAAFKAHVILGFWKGALIQDPENFLQNRANNGGEAMGHLGRITSLESLPPKHILLDFMSQAMHLNKGGIKLPTKAKGDKIEIDIPVDLMDGFAKNMDASNTFFKFSHSNKREYIQWINEAKTADTRKKRLDTALEWMAEGKIRNWKYAVKKQI